MNATIVDSTDRPVITHEDATHIETDPLGSIQRRAAYLDPAYRAAYFGPIGTVVCETPNKEFWRRVYGELGRTRRRLKQVFGRKESEAPNAWTPAPQDGATRLDQPGLRRLTFSGLLLVDSSEVPLHAWPTRKQVGYKPRRRGGQGRRLRRGQSATE